MKDKSISRRQFMKYGLGGLAALALGSKMKWMLKDPAFAEVPQVQSLNFTITDAIKEMVTHNAINPATCYLWCYKETRWPADVPGPIILCTRGDTIEISITNALDEPHAFSIPGIFDSGPIAPGQTVVGAFNATTSGTYLYHDNLNEPVNRVMGLHGALIVIPEAPALGHKYTPYDNPTPAIQQLFDELGTAAHWPGLAWEESDPNEASFTPPFRQYVWLMHQVSPGLFAQVGKLPAGEIFPPEEFVDIFLNDPFVPPRRITNRRRVRNASRGVPSRKPEFFTFNGQSGHFSHNNSFIQPILRVGEPALVRVLNAGLWHHS